MSPSHPSEGQNTTNCHTRQLSLLSYFHIYEEVFNSSCVFSLVRIPPPPWTANRYHGQNSHPGETQVLLGIEETERDVLCTLLSCQLLVNITNRRIMTIMSE